MASDVGQILPKGVVHFHPQECAFIEDLAARRDGIKATYGIQHNGTYDGLTETKDMHVLNAFGEFAVARLFGGEVDESILIRGSRRGNVILPNKRVQVIARGERGRDFALKSADAKDFYCPFGLLVWPVRAYHGPGHTVQVVGWISRDEFLAKAGTATLNAKRLLVTYRQMHRITEPMRPWVQVIQPPLL